MKVKVAIYFPFREEVPEDPVVLNVPNGATVGQAVAALVARYPFLGPRLYDAHAQIHRHVSALVNGTSIQFKRGWDTALNDGDELTILPPVGGG